LKTVNGFQKFLKDKMHFSTLPQSWSKDLMSWQQEQKLGNGVTFLDTQKLFVVLWSRWKNAESWSIPSWW